MNNELEIEAELEIVELGDAKEETKGMPAGNDSEVHPQLSFRID